MSEATKHVVCAADELTLGTRRIVEVEGRSIGIFNVGGSLYAILNRCPHRGAPLCRGTVGGTMLPSSPHVYVYGLEDRLLRCPWHGWEIDLATGRPLFDPERAKVRTFPVTVQDGQVVVEIAGAGA
jgi:nitrite reductase/ring-hydroxylating ferredoxin subunit